MTVQVILAVACCVACGGRWRTANAAKALGLAGSVAVVAGTSLLMGWDKDSRYLVPWLPKDVTTTALLLKRCWNSGTGASFCTCVGLNAKCAPAVSSALFVVALLGFCSFVAAGRGR